MGNTRFLSALIGLAGGGACTLALAVLLFCPAASPRRASAAAPTSIARLSTFPIGGAFSPPAHQPQIHAALHFGASATRGFCACYAPGTDESYMSRMEALIRPMNRIAFSADTRWSATAGGGAGSSGSPVTLTYSFVPDYTNGSPETSNVLFSALDGQFGTTAAWKSIFRRVFSSWSNLTGITFVETSDDGAAWPDSPGVLNVRGDVRIVSLAIDGLDGVLAYNYFPNVGDMSLDSAESWADSTGDYIFMRNVLTHELGHGLGLQHVLPRDSTKLMEAYLSTNFDGPQDDDVRGAGSFYGDPFEANDSLASAADLGTHSANASFDNLMLHSKTDIDWYAVTLDARHLVTITATPVGGSYQVGPDPGTPQSVNTLAVNPLNVDVYDKTGTTLLASATALAAGQSATAAGAVLPEGDEEFRVKVTAAGTTADVQRYSLSMTLTADPTNGLSAHAGTDAHISEDGEVQLSGSATGGTPPYSYRWSPSTGLSDALIADPTATPAATTTYTLTVTDSAANSDTDDITVRVTSRLVADAGDDKLVLAGQTFTLSATAAGGTPPYAYRWSPTTGLNNAGSAAPTGVVSASKAYTLTITDADGTQATDAVTLTVVSALTADVSGDELIAPGEAAQLTAQVFGGVAPYTYEWSPAGNALTADGSVIQAFPAATTSYSVVIRDGLGQSASAAMQVEVAPALVVSAGSAIEISADDVITLDGAASGGREPYTVSWSPATALTDPNVLRPVATPDETTTYTLSVTDALGQHGQASVVVTVTGGSGGSNSGSDDAGDPGSTENAPSNPCGGGIFVMLPLVLAGLLPMRHRFAHRKP